VENPMTAYQATKAFLAGLNPTTETQKQAVASANALAGQIEHGRHLDELAARGPANWRWRHVIWAVVLFFGMGLFA
jgi:hypothetical protein